MSGIKRKGSLPLIGLLAVFSVLIAGAARAESWEVQPPHVVPPAPAPFHFSNPALERDHARLNAQIDAALTVFRDSTDAAEDALWAARDADPGSPTWGQARDAMQRAVRDFAPLRTALLTYIAFLGRASHTAPPNENLYAIQVRDETQSQLAGTYDRLVEQLERLARSTLGTENGSGMALLAENPNRAMPAMSRRRPFFSGIISDDGLAKTTDCWQE